MHMKRTKSAFRKDLLMMVPSSITLCNALCGLSAILYMTGDHASETLVPLPAVWLILLAMFFDIFDGFAARKLNAVSTHGVQLDSLSDLLSFGIAPAILIFLVAQGCCSGSLFGQWIAWSVSGFFMVCALWRLALYNTHRPLRDSFRGLLFRSSDPRGYRHSLLYDSTLHPGQHRSPYGGIHHHRVWYYHGLNDDQRI